LPRSASDRDQIVDNAVRSHSIENKTDRDHAAELRITYASLHSRVGLSEYQLSLPTHTALTMTYKHMGRGGRWGVARQLLQQRAVGQCSVLRWPPLIASPHSLRQGDQLAMFTVTGSIAPANPIIL